MSSIDKLSIEGLDWAEMTVEQKVQAAKAIAVWIGAVLLGIIVAGPIGFFVGIFGGRALTRTLGLWNVPASPAISPPVAGDPAPTADIRPVRRPTEASPVRQSTGDLIGSLDLEPLEELLLRIRWNGSAYVVRNASGVVLGQITVEPGQAMVDLKNKDGSVIARFAHVDGQSLRVITQGTVMRVLADPSESQ